MSAGFPRRVDCALGTARLDAPPRRVVALSDIDQEILLALGTEPVAMAESPAGATGLAPWVAEALAGPAPILLDAREGIPYATIAALEPDLIVHSYAGAAGAAAFAALTAIAPTIGFRRGLHLDGWRERLALVAEALGAERRARELEARLGEEIAGLRERHPALRGRTCALAFAGSPARIGTVRSPEDHRARLMAELGLTTPPVMEGLAAADRDGATAAIGPDRLGALEADVVLLGADSPAVAAALEAEPAYAALAEGGRLVTLDPPTSLALLRPSPLSIPHALERIVPRLARALARPRSEAR